MASSKWSDEKKRLESLSIDDRRKAYSCGKNFKPVTQIPTWREYFEDSKDSLSQKVSDAEVSSFQSENKDLISDASLADKISIFRGDITTLELDAIVNAANESLLGGGGVDGAIHRAAGKLLLEECKTLNGCETGQSKITCAYNLPAKYIIHTVGPVGEKPAFLQRCYENCLDLAAKNNLKTVAFPCISTGIYGYPPLNAALIALKVVKKFLIQHPGKMDRVIFCLFMENDVDIYEKNLQIYFPM